MRRALSCVLLCVALAVPSWGARVKGGRAFKEHEKIVLTADDVPKGAQVLWDVSGECDVEEAEGRLYVWAKPGTYTVVMTAIDFESKKVVRARTSFTVLADKPPEPPTPTPPGPGPKPPEPPGPPAPIAGDGVRVLIVYESEQQTKMPPGQQQMVFGAPFHKWLGTVCTDDPQTGDKKAWWVLDKDADVSSLAKHWQDAFKREKKSLPWVVISNGKTGYEGPLPANVDEAQALVKKYAEVKK